MYTQRLKIGKYRHIYEDILHLSRRLGLQDLTFHLRAVEEKREIYLFCLVAIRLHDIVKCVIICVHNIRRSNIIKDGVTFSGLS